MVTTYKAIDLCYFYDEFRMDEAYLVLSANNDLNEKVTKKIKVSSRRFLEVEYGKKQEVQILLKNVETESYDILVVPCENGIYRLDDMLLNIYWNIEPVMYSEWVEIRKDYLKNLSYITISDHAIVIDSSDNYTCNKIIRIRGEAKLQGTEVFLKKVSCYGLCTEINSSIFDKCLQGETISDGDFLYLTEDIEHGVHIYLEFDSIQFHLTHDRVSIEKVIGSNYGIDEKIVCTISNERIGMVSMLFSKIMRTETDKSTLQFLSEYFLT